MSFYRIQDTLAANKKHFTVSDYRALASIAQAPAFEYRKVLEKKVDAVPYLPSFAQRLEVKLASIGLEIKSIPANDGTNRKLYALCEVEVAK